MTDGSLANLRFAMQQDQARLAVLKYGNEYPTGVLEKAVSAAQAAMHQDRTPDENAAAAEAAAQKILEASPKK